MAGEVGADELRLSDWIDDKVVIPLLREQSRRVISRLRQPDTAFKLQLFFDDSDAANLDCARRVHRKQIEWSQVQRDRGVSKATLSTQLNRTRIKLLMSRVLLFHDPGWNLQTLLRLRQDQRVRESYAQEAHLRFDIVNGVDWQRSKIIVPHPARAEHRLSDEEGSRLTWAANLHRDDRLNICLAQQAAGLVPAARLVISFPTLAAELERRRPMFRNLPDKLSGPVGRAEEARVDGRR